MAAAAGLPTVPTVPTVQGLKSRTFYSENIPHPPASSPVQVQVQVQAQVQAQRSDRSAPWSREHPDHPTVYLPQIGREKKLCQPSWEMNLFTLAAIQTCAYILVSNLKTRRYTPDPRWSAVGIKEAEPFKVDDCGNLPRGVWRWRLTLRSWGREYQTGSRWVSLRGAHLSGWGLTRGVSSVLLAVGGGASVGGGAAGPPPEKFENCRCNFPHSVAFLWVSKM